MEAVHPSPVLKAKIHVVVNGAMRRPQMLSHRRLVTAVSVKRSPSSGRKAYPLS